MSRKGWMRKWCGWVNGCGGDGGDGDGDGGGGGGWCRLLWVVVVATTMLLQRCC